MACTKPAAAALDQGGWLGDGVGGRTTGLRAPRPGAGPAPAAQLHASSRGAVAAAAVDPAAAAAAPAVDGGSDCGEAGSRLARLDACLASGDLAAHAALCAELGIRGPTYSRRAFPELAPAALAVGYALLSCGAAGAPWPPGAAAAAGGGAARAAGWAAECRRCYRRYRLMALRAYYDRASATGLVADRIVQLFPGGARKYHLVAGLVALRRISEWLGGAPSADGAGGGAGGAGGGGVGGGP
ncbi:hypothetical protein Rsub_07299 [Raphidocelis subcapitata]|uniref:Uncharacterized protein n=1 Tax=Raphidocelis subcapitata TaxID=307507 RepID=A0A2V0P2C7_9CHLO|nr:hypothetical protein Rsub_07299 [Raphidocelis subcapitata]|eukprot:GBF94031.1 hypothetical protein Rsub_07299 [Raphidocelis subcapitata]